MASAAAAVITVGSALRAVPRPIRVLTVDGHQLVQEGLAAMINREADMTVVAIASTGEEAIDDVRRYRPDVVTLDLLLPDMPGEDLARRILAEFPRTRIVAITSAQGHMHARRALDAGVHGYLSKAVPVCELVRAIRQVQAGGRMIPGPVAFQVGGPVTPEPLTAREIEVLRLVAWGNGNKQVAAQLSIAGETVRMHMKNILEKLGAHDRAHAVTIALTRGILRLDDLSGAELGRARWTH
jgi:two-component system NarL family response regulator